MKELVYIENITLKLMLKYLECNSWVIDKDYKNKKVIILKKDDIVIMLPSSDEYRDYKQRLFESICLLSKINGKSFKEITDDIKDFTSDKISFRIVGDIVQEGKIPLSFASRYVSAIKDLIIAAACNEENPKPYFKSLPDTSKRYIENFKFAQTQVGSFIFNIETDHYNDSKIQLCMDEDGNQIEEPPLQRKIVRRVVNGLKQIEKKEGFDLDEIGSNGYKQGLNANMCDALLEIKDISENVEIESSFKLTKVVNDSSSFEETIVINNNSFRKAEVISKIYKDNKSTEELELNCEVVEIRKSRDNLGSGTVLAKFKYYGDNRDHTVKVDLDGMHYRTACDALKDNLNIKVSCTLNKTNKEWNVSSINELSIIDNI